MRGQDPEVDENEDEDGSSAPNVDEDQLIAEAVRAAVSSAHPSVVPSVSAYDSSPSPTSSDHYLEVGLVFFDVNHSISYSFLH